MYQEILKKFTSLFPLWAVLLSAVAYVYPEYFAPHQGLIVPFLSLIMLGMGVTLSVDSFLAVLKKPSVVFLGTLMKYTIMPLSAWIVCFVLKLPADLMTGVILLGCCPGGTASNVICYLAKGDVALSIVLTSVSTLLAFLATPFLTWVFIGHSSFWSMLFWSSIWNKYMTPNLRAARSYVTSDPATKTDSSSLSRKVDAKDPTDTIKKDSVSPDPKSNLKPKVKTTTTRIRRSGRR